jgi:hypothetical protein
LVESVSEDALLRLFGAGEHEIILRLQFDKHLVFTVYLFKAASVSLAALGIDSLKTFPDAGRLLHPRTSTVMRGGTMRGASPDGQHAGRKAVA